jgi:hypothetical protein
MNAMFITQLGHGIRKIIWQVRTALGGQLDYLRSAATTRAYRRNICTHGAATNNDNLGFRWGE